ncbi:MAG TPA: SRPBCC domain-containing protein [Chitinophagaceae bacterium]
MIRFGDNYAEIEMPYRGSTMNGMLLWLDEHLIKQWWNLSEAKIEPKTGGVFYLRWPVKEDRGSRVIYGILDELDTEAGSFSVKKIIYMNDGTKMSGFVLEVLFIRYSESNSAIKVRLSHPLDSSTKVFFDKSVLKSWPGALALFRKFVEY